MASSAVACAVCPSCQRNSVVRRNGLVRISHASKFYPSSGIAANKDVPTETLEKVRKAARRLGSRIDDPFMAMSFLALPVIPALKLTDKGLVDVETFELTSLFV